jgi:hypothetical protein
LPLGGVAEKRAADGPGQNRDRSEGKYCGASGPFGNQGSKGGKGRF